MADKWIPVRDKLPADDEWVQVQTQDGTVYPASYKNNQWVPLFRGGLVDHLMHGKVAYWLPHVSGYPYVQCKCGSFYLQVEGNKQCPICASMWLLDTKTEDKPKRTPKAAKKPVEPAELPFDDEPAKVESFDEDIFI